MVEKKDSLFMPERNLASVSTSSTVPAWAGGTFIWRLCLADRADALVEAAETIAAVDHSLDHAVEHIVFLSGAIGADEGWLPWDGVWPYWQRLTWRIGGGWEGLSRFMVAMRDRHRAHISFHVNCTDVNAGLRLYPETREFFQQLVEAKAIYARPQGFNAQPWFGLPYVPQTISDADPSHMFAMVNYQRYWESGLAREQIDGLFGRLPYLPPLLYVDVLGPLGWCIHPGYPDGDLGGSKASQLAGVQAIVKYIRDCGSDVAGESPDQLMEHTDPPIRYSWGHGGLSRNDYGQIGSGYGTGACARRGGKGMHVYGNQGSYHLQCGESVPDLIKRGWEPMAADGQAVTGAFADPLRSPQIDGLRDWGNVDDLVRQFHFTVARELYHIGCGAERLPGGPTWERLDAAEGRVRLDALTLRNPHGEVQVFEAEAGTLLGSVRIVQDNWASGGQAVADLDEALGNGVELAIDAPVAGDYTAFVRYASVGGGALRLQVDDAPPLRLELPDTGAWQHYGDHPVALRLTPGPHRLRLQHERLYAEWSDGARAEWTLDTGFRAEHGEVELGVAGNRFTPDTWSGQLRILLYSELGGERIWTLPASWSGIARVQLVPLTDGGRDLRSAQTVPVNGNRQCRLTLLANQAAVLLPAPPQSIRSIRSTKSTHSPPPPPPPSKTTLPPKLCPPHSPPSPPAPRSVLPAPSSVLPAPRPVLQAPHPVLQAPHSPLRAPSSELRAPRSPLRAPSPVLQAPCSKLRAPSSVLQAPHSPLRAPSSALPAPRSALRAPCSELRAPRSPLRAPRSPLPAPRSPLRAPSSALPAPRSALRAPSPRATVD